MNFTDLLYTIRHRGVHMRVENGQLVTTAANQLTEELIGQMRARKAELIHWIEQQEIHYRYILPAPQQDLYPVSYAQNRLWLFQQLTNSDTYYLSDSFYLYTELDEPAFRQAIDTVYRKHESLRTVFVFHEGSPRQRICRPDEQELPYRFTDLSASGDRDALMHTMISQEEKALFSLEKGPLFRVQLIKLSRTRFLFQLVIHHIISDHWSMKIFTRELIEAYDLFVQGKATNAEPLKIQYRDYAYWEQSPIAQEKIKKGLSFWTTYLKGDLPVINLHTDHPRPLNKRYNGRDFFLRLDSSMGKKLNRFCTTHHVTPYIVCLTAINILLARYTEQEELILGLSLNGRNNPDVENQLGFFINLLPLRTKVQRQDSAITLLQAIRTDTWNIFEHQDVPFAEILSSIRYKRITERFPLFDILVEFGEDEQTLSRGSLDNIKTELYYTETRHSQFELLFYFVREADNILLKINYDTDLYREERIRAMAGHFRNVLETMLDNPTLPIRQFRLMTATEEMALRLQSGLQADPVSATPFNSIIKLFEATVATLGHLPVLDLDKQFTSYKALQEKANALAALIQNKYAISKGDRVGIMLPNSDLTVITMLAILKTGAAFVPIDYARPEEYRKKIIQTAGLKLLVFHSAFLFTLGDPGQTPLLMADAELTMLPPLPVFENVWHQPNDTAYILFTSGSTGEPKGVEVTMNSFSNYVTWANQYYFQGDSGWNFAFFTPITFDLTLTSIFTTLLRGDVIRIFANTDPLELIRQVFTTPGVDVVKITPTHARLIKDAGIHQSDIRMVICGGEMLLPADVTALQSLTPGVRIFDEYGPTEATVGCTAKEIVSPQDASIIGKPIGGARVFVMDTFRNLQPLGCAGEIYIGGACLAKGYLADLALTKEKFIQLSGGERLYKSGDLGLWTWNGELQFLGRKDKQVKLHGIRIELSEIGNCIQAISGVKDAVVQIYEDATADKTLEAFVVSTGITAKNIREHCRRYLPDYMIPGRIFLIAAMPVNENGKTDMAALQQLRSEIIYEPTTEELPQTPLQQLFISIMAEVLGIASHTTNFNFIELGGDSIKAIRVCGRLYQEGYKLSVADLLANPTFEDVAPFITEVKQKVTQQAVEGEIPLTPIQQQFFTNAGADPHHYNQSYLLSRTNRFDEQMVRAIFSLLLEHHDILRVSFTRNDDKIVQFNHAKIDSLPLQVFDLTEHPDAENILVSIGERIERSFELHRHPLMSIALFQMDGIDKLLISIHHLLVDEVSWTILLEDINSLIKQYKSGVPLSLPAKTDSYQQWAQALDRMANDPATREAYAYWQSMERRNIGSFPINDQVAVSFAGDTNTIRFQLDNVLTETLLTNANVPYNTRIEDLLITALGLAINTSFGIGNYLLEHEGHGREDIDGAVNVSRTIGFFSSLCPVLLPAGGQDLAQVIKETKESLRQVVRNSLAYGVFRHLAPPSLKTNSFFPDTPPLVFNYLGHHDGAATALEFEIETYPGKSISDSTPRWHQLEMEAYISDMTLTVSITYAPTQYAPPVIAKLMHDYQEALLQIISFCESRSERELTPDDMTYKDLSLAELKDINDVFN